MAERAVDQQLDYDLAEGRQSAVNLENICTHLALILRHRKRVLTVWFAVVALSLLYAFLWPGTWASHATMMSITPPNPLGMMGMMNGGDGGMDKLAQLGLGASEKDSKLINILKSRTLAENVIVESGYLAHEHPGEWNQNSRTWTDPDDAVPMEKVIRKFQKKVWSVRLDKQDKLIEVQARAKSPELAQAVALCAMEELQAILNGKSFSVAGQNRRFIEKRLTEVERDLKTAELELKQFKQEHGLYDLERQIGGAINLVAELESQLLARQMEMGMLLKISTPKNPKVEYLQNEIAEIEKQIQNVKLGQQDQNVNLEMIPALKETPELLLQFVRLKRTFMVQEKLFGLLTTQFEIAKIEEVRDDLAFQIIDQPNLPVKKESPKKRVVVLFGLILGMLGGVGAAYARQYDEEIRGIIDKIKGGSDDPEKS